VYVVSISRSQTMQVYLSTCFVLAQLASGADLVTRFGIVTDIHYADAPPGGSRIYRDGLAKLKQATAQFNSMSTDFVIELGDFKDTDQNEANTLGYIDDIEKGLAEFDGPRYHVLGNHDVDILNQSQLLSHVSNCGQKTSVGFYSFDAPSNSTPPAAQQPDTAGCLLKDTTSNVWIVHNDSTRNWVSRPTAGCHDKALRIPQIAAYPKRPAAHYNLNATQSATACANTGCPSAPQPPAPPGPGALPGLHFVVLNGDFNAQDEPWYDIEHQTKQFGWQSPWVPASQMEWLSQDLQAAKARGQKAVVFVHYRLDGGPGMNASRTVDTMSLDNAAVLRAVLEESGVVLATFSGHDHTPNPTHTISNGVLYFTHHAMVEGHFPESNAFSAVDVMSDCSVVVRGYVNATSLIYPGAPGCAVRV
jgi:hypothetical protein